MSENKYNKLINANDLLNLIYALDKKILDINKISISKIKELIIKLPRIDPTKIPRFQLWDIVESNWISSEPLIITEILDNKRYNVYSTYTKITYNDISEDNLIFYSERSK